MSRNKMLLNINAKTILWWVFHIWAAINLAQGI